MTEIRGKYRAFVTIGDNNVERGEELAKELSSSEHLPLFCFRTNRWFYRNAQYVKCDILDWEEQVTVFEAARNNSPHNSCDIVIANAGIGRGTGDSLFKLDGKLSQMSKPWQADPNFRSPWVTRKAWIEDYPG
jgi:NAD(P)-dependent dehydrogenase (short-subunit alcohol dehydrogenase family)